MLDLDKVIESCAKGDRAAARELYEHFSPRLFGVCMRYCKNRMEAEDFLHDGFIKIFDNLSKYKHLGSFEGWMRRVMVNTILESFRKEKRIRFADENNLPKHLADETELDDSFEMPGLDEISRVVQVMPHRYKMVFNLFVIEDYTHEEIANHLGISIGTSKSNLARARQWLKKKLRAEKEINLLNYGKI